MAPVYKIAIIQLHPKPMQPASNYARAAQFITNAASRGAQLAVLPEYHLTNWVPDEPEFGSLCDQWELYLEKYRALAKELKMCIVPGTIVERHQDAETEEDRLINVAYFIGNDGEILGRYQKKNLWYTVPSSSTSFMFAPFISLKDTSSFKRHPERPHLTSSTHAPHMAISTPLGPIGMLICWDLAFPEAFRELIAGGAKIIIIPTFWTLTDCSPYGLSLNPRSEALFLETALTARAFENTCAIVFVNAGGAQGSKDSPYAGLSRVTVPFLGALGDETKDTHEEAMSIVELDMQLVEEAERQYKVREDMAGEDWHYEYRHGRPDRRAKL